MIQTDAKVVFTSAAKVLQINNKSTILSNKYSKDYHSLVKYCLKVRGFCLSIIDPEVLFPNGALVQILDPPANRLTTQTRLMETI